MPVFSPDSVILYCADVEASSRFYGDILAQEPLETFEGFAVFALSDTIRLGLQAADQIDPKAEEYFGGSDRATVDRLHSDWRARGVKMALEPTELDFGYTFVALDPDGHRLRVCATDTSGLSGRLTEC